MIGQTIYLRALEPEDIDLLYLWENDAGIWHYSHTIEPFSRFALEQYVLNAERDIFIARQLRLMIVLKEPETTIGMIDLFDFDPVHQRAGIGIMISKQAQGHGYASEALELLIEYGFTTLNLHQLYCNIAEDNTISLDLFKKHGFTICGNKKEWLRKGDTFTGEYLLQLIRP